MTIKRITKAVDRPRICTYDFEWWPDSLELRLCGLWDDGRYYSFQTLDDFFDHVLRREYRGVWFFAHAGGTSDFLFFLEWIRRHDEYEVNIRYSSSAAVHVEFRRGKDRWIFVDSFFLLRTSLRKIAKFVNMEKGGAEGSTSIFTTENEEELREYNALDCEILYVALQQFEQFLVGMGGELRPTMASCALTLFRRKYLRADIRTYKKANVALRSAYVASRVEVFRKFGADLYQYDINSSFPFSMTRPAPGELKMVTQRVPDSGEMFFAEATVSVPEQHIPPLPYRAGGKVYFPVGKWRSWFSGVDFREAEKYGKIERVHKVWTYEARTDMASYVQDIYEKRRVAEEGSFGKEIMKLLMNSLYGKWGEQTEKTSVIINPRSRDVLSQEGAVEMMPGVIMITEERDIPHEHLPFAAHITANSRRLITDYLRACGDPYYCDTDCIVTQDPTLPTSDKLGDLKLEAKIAAGEFYAPKFYKISVEGKDGAIEKVKAKGFTGITGAAFDHLVGKGLVLREDFKLGRAAPCSLVATRQPAVAIERMARSRELLARAAREERMGRGEGALRPVLQIIPKQLRFESDKRVFEPDGSRSRPYTLEEIVGMGQTTP